MKASKTSSSTTTEALNGENGDIARYRQLYEDAEKFAREVAEFRESISIPAHNELRYAGHHLLQSLDDDGTVADQEQLRRACNHCERAMYEAAEAGITSLLISIRQFKDDYKDIVISEVVSAYSDHKASARDAQQLLIRGRSKEATATATASEYMQAFRKLRKASDTLEDAKDDLNAKLMDQERKARQFIFRMTITLLGTSVALVAMLF